MEKRSYKYLSFITGFYITVQVGCLIGGAKLVSLWWFVVPATVLFFPITYIFSDIITEVYGYAHARRVVWQVTISMIVASLMYQVIKFLPPAPGFQYNDAYARVLGVVPRVLIGSWIASWTGGMVNDYILAKMKVWTSGKHLWMRTIGSTIFGEGVNTIIFYTIAFIGVIPFGLLIKAIFSGWVLKTAIETLMTPVTYYVVKKLKKAEQEDRYDRDTNFNPFMVKV